MAKKGYSGHEEDDVREKCFINKRKYIRDSGSFLRARISKNKKHWRDVEIGDISANGLNFHSDDSYEENDDLWFDLSTHNILLDIDIRILGTICRKIANENGGISYGVTFNNPSTELQIQLDEIIIARLRAKGRV